MAGPWDRYAQPAASDAPAGPWAKYAPPEASATDNFLSGAGIALRNVAVGAKQRMDEGAAALERGLGQTAPGRLLNRAGAAMGLPTAASALDATNARVVADRAADAPVMATTAGKVGAVAGAAVPAVLSAMIPGGQALTGSILSGAALGAAQPTIEGESAAKNALLGAAGGGAAYGVGKGLALAGSKLAARNTQAATDNAMRDATAAAAREAGYVLPPTSTNPSLTNRLLEGLAGKITTAQKASVENQGVTNRLAAKALGLADDTPITPAVLATVRKDASGAYDVVKGLGTVQADAKYLADLSGITSGVNKAAANFPGLVKSDLDEIIGSLKQPTFEADAAVEATKVLRDRAQAAFASGDKSTGKALRQASDAIEGVLERQLAATGDKAAIEAFRDARQLIAKTYTVEKALNGSTGNVSAQALGKQLAKGAPISGDLRTVAQTGQAFPKAVQEIRDSVPGLSPLDYALAVGTGNPVMLGARPLARTAILTPMYQRLMGTPSYSNAMAEALMSPATTAGTRALMSPQPTK